MKSNGKLDEIFKILKLKGFFGKDAAKRQTEENKNESFEKTKKRRRNTLNDHSKTEQISNIRR
jgi:hypothetical protein